MTELKQQLIEAANGLSEARLLVREREIALEQLVETLTAGSAQNDERRAKFKREAAPATPRKPRVDAAKPVKPISAQQQKIVDVLRAANMPISVPVVADRAGCSTSNAYYHLSTMREQGKVRLLEDGWELTSAAKEAA